MSLLYSIFSLLFVLFGMGRKKNKLLSQITSQSLVFVNKFLMKDCKCQNGGEEGKLFGVTATALQKQVSGLAADLAVKPKRHGRRSRIIS